LITQILSNYTNEIFITILFLLNAYQSKVDAQRIITYSDKNFSFVLKLDSLPKDDYTWGSSKVTVTLITVTRLKDNKIIQRIIPKENYITDKEYELIFDDFNFDGFIDFRLHSFTAKHGQTGYQFYLFNPKKGKFIYSKEIAEVLDDAYIDSSKKTLSHIYKVMGGEYRLVVYKFINHKLTLIEERINKSIGNNEYQIIYKKRIDGIMKIIRSEILKEDTYKKMDDRLFPI
jgi:hypothetical protein